MRSVLLVVLGAAACLGFAVRPAPPSAAQAPVVITVTSAGDTGDAACPHASNCTLRKAIDTANAEPTPSTPVTITFLPTAFPMAAPATITPASPLPVLLRQLTTIDATQAGVVLSGSGLPSNALADGLVLGGQGSKVRGMAFDGFLAACLVLRAGSATAGGNADLRDGNRFGKCGTGVDAAGPGSFVYGNTFGIRPAGAPATSGTAIVVSASGVTIGGEGALANEIGNVATAIQVGLGSGSPVTGVRIAGNTVGKRRSGAPAPVSVGVDLRQPSTGTTVENNLFANISGPAIRLAMEAGGQNTTANRLSPNRFEALGALAIDFNGDGLRNPPAASGPNGGRGFPTITRAAGSSVSGTTDPPCANCSVTVYAAVHAAGADRDYGAAPLPGGMAQTGANGAFFLDGVSLPAGAWVIALVTDAAGNTSEFGPSAHIGGGALRCDPVILGAGWNHAGYFGVASEPLGDAFPPGLPGPSRVRSIFALDDGSTGFRAWFAGAPGSTLETLEVGEAYWFFVREAIALEGGFTLSAALPVALEAGWNDFVYFGATADVRDALASIAGKYTAVYRYVTTADGERWESAGDDTTPPWARDFSELRACGTYHVLMTAAAVLTPLQP